MYFFCIAQLKTVNATVQAQSKCVYGSTRVYPVQMSLSLSLLYFYFCHFAWFSVCASTRTVVVQGIRCIKNVAYFAAPPTMVAKCLLSASTYQHAHQICSGKATKAATRERKRESEGERRRGRGRNRHFITAAAQADCLNGIREAKTLLFPSVFVFVALHFRLRLRLRHITNGISL